MVSSKLEMDSSQSSIDHNWHTNQQSDNLSSDAIRGLSIDLRKHHLMSVEPGIKRRLSLCRWAEPDTD